ncbi:HAD-IB family phosphatase [Pelagerythrobacter sp.]|uniref:HAD-IB family phosphatase n=1 Tax=Pelagerythrobacter sp. TaxID=2800702 RepID=UPI0035B2492F
MRIAIYDLDRTVLRHASYTPFLIFAARRRAPLRLASVPVWIAAMALYKLRLFSRDALKNFGLRLFIGRDADDAALDDLGAAFARRIIPGWVAPGAAASIARERAEGHRLVLATAAMGFYARPIGDLLGFDAVIATPHVADPGRHAPRIAGGNCYGAGKLEACRRWLEEAGVVRGEARLRFYSDSASDAPMLDFADEALFVTARPAVARRARDRGWLPVDFRR